MKALKEMVIAADGRKRSTMARIRRFTAIATVLCALLAAPATLATAKMQDAALHIVVIEGEDSVNIIGQGTAIPTLVEVRDRNDLPVSGAAVVFLLGDGGTAALNGGLQQVVSTTNALGQAAVTVNPVASGAVQLTVNATFEGQTAAASIVQTNFATVAEAAAAATGTTSSAGGSTASGAGAAAAGGGLGAGALAGIVGAAAGAAVGVGVAVSGDDAATNNRDDQTPDDEDERTPNDDDDDATPDDEGNDDPTPTASVPSAPAAPRVTPGDRELHVRWDTPPDNGSPINDYDVRYRTDNDPWTELPDAPKSTSTSATIQGLRNGTTYEVQIRAGNRAGDSAWSPSASGTPVGTDTAGVRRDRAALMELYRATDGENWAGNNNWNTSEPLEDWEGVATNSRGRVTVLWLPSHRLRGTIPSGLSKLTELKSLELSGNSRLTGSIPSSLGNLRNLEAIALWGSGLTGSIPASLGNLSNLTTLGLEANYLTGSVPTSLGNLKKLTTLRLEWNALTGSIPSSLGNLRNLTKLSLELNFLTGSIPAALCQFQYSINPQFKGETEEVDLPCASSANATVEMAGLSIEDARTQESPSAMVAFTVTLNQMGTSQVTVDYATQDDSAQAGEDYAPTSGTLTFAVGEASKTIEVEILDDAHDEGEESFLLTLSNAVGARLNDAEATGTIENADPLPAALMARFGRASAEHVMEQVADRMGERREPGFRARFGGQEVQQGREGEIARSLLSELNRGAGTHRSPISSHPGGGGISRHGREGRGPGMGGGTFRPDQTEIGGLLSSAEFELNRARNDGVLSVWSRSARSRFGGRDGALALNGDVRTTMIGADYTRGRLVAGLSLARSHGVGGYAGRHAGQVETSATGLYPWLGYRISDRFSVWGVTGYGGGVLRLTPDGTAPIESGLSMAMAAAGTRGELVGSGAGDGFKLAFKSDALWVGTSVDGADGAAGKLARAEATVTRVRTAIEASQHFTLGGRMALTPSVEVGLRQDGGDAETGTGMDVAGGVAFTDPTTGLSIAVRGRMLVAHQAEGFTDRGMSLSVGWNPTPTSPLGFSARVTPSWGGQDSGTLWNGEPLSQFRTHGERSSPGRLDGELGYGLPVGKSLVGTPRIGFSSSAHGRGYRLGYSVRALDREKTDLELGVETQLRQDPTHGGTETSVLGRASVRW